MAQGSARRRRGDSRTADRARPALLLLLATGLPACGSGGDANAGDGAVSSHDASAANEMTADAATVETMTADAAASGDAGSDSAADTEVPDASDEPPPCTGTPQSPKGSCLLLVSDAGPPLLCIEFTGSMFTPDSMMAACSALTSGSTLVSAYTTQACATAGIVGRCIESCALPGESVGYYYPGGGRVSGFGAPAKARHQGVQVPARPVPSGL